MAGGTIKSLVGQLRINRGIGTLLILNVVFSLLSQFIPSEYFSLPAETTQTLLRPWTFLSYMFTQLRFSHFFINLLCLLIVGMLISRMLTSTQSVILYLAGGISGALFFCFFYSSIPSEYALHSYLDGSSAAIYALLTYASLLRPHLKISIFGIFNAELKWLVAILVMVNILGLAGENFAANFAHLGGCFGAAVYFTVIRLSRMRRGFFRDDDNAELQEIMTKVRVSGYSSLDDNERETLINQSKEQ